MNMENFVTGIQHIGIPTNNLNHSISFYKKLGFCLVGHENDPNNQANVAFLRLKNLTVEIYESKHAPQSDGAINHIAIDVSNIDLVHQTVIEVLCSENGPDEKIITPEIHFLPFWENGIKYFIIPGPNQEKIEFCQILSTPEDI